MKVQLRRLIPSDRTLLKQLLEITISDAYIKNEVNVSYQSEIIYKMKLFDNYFSVENGYYLGVFEGENLIGVMATSKLEDIHKEELKTNDDESRLIHTAYVHPDYQKKGVGSKLLTRLINKLNRENYKYVVLDSGFDLAKVYWDKKFGKPKVILENYFENGDNLYIWMSQISNLM